MHSIDFTPTVPHLFPAARAALTRTPFSHRSGEFEALAACACARLEALAASGGGRFQTILAAGTGTWANEVMAGYFLSGARRALVMVNGEFGERLHAQCMRIRPDTVRVETPWGEAYDEERLERTGRRYPEIDVLFAVATETSCGRTNDLASLDRFARARGARLCLDGVSAVGVDPRLFSWPSVSAVSASSGKALAALPGVSVVFLDRNALTRRKDVGASASASWPRWSLDLTRLVEAKKSPGGVLNTLASPLLACFSASLEALTQLGDYPERLRDRRRRIVEAAQLGGATPWPGSDSPLVACFRRPGDAAWRRMRRRLAVANVRVYDEPRYLAERGLFEVAAMGDVREKDLSRLTNALAGRSAPASRRIRFHRKAGRASVAPASGD